MFRRAALCLVLATGCGRLGFDDVAGTLGNDAAVDGRALDAPACTPGTWGTLRPQLQLRSSQNDWEAALHPNGLVMMFARQDSGNSDLWVTTRSSTSADFGSPMQVAAGTSPTNLEYGPLWSPDGTTLTFRWDDGISQSEARQIDHLGNGAFSSSYQIVTMPSGSFSWDLTPNNLELFFTTVDAGGMDYDLGHATRATEASPWVVDDALEGLNRVGKAEGWPAYDAGRGVLFYERDDPAGAEIVEAERPTPGAPFAVTQVADFVADQDGDPEISDDGLTLVFSSQRLGGGTQNDIFLTTRSCP